MSIEDPKPSGALVPASRTAGRHRAPGWRERLRDTPFWPVLRALRAVWRVVWPPLAFTFLAAVAVVIGFVTALMFLIGAWHF